MSRVEQKINITIILYQKLIELSLLSTTVGPEHKPLLQLGVANQQQFCVIMCHACKYFNFFKTQQ